METIEMKQPVITLFCAFTRDWAVDRWLDNLRASLPDPTQTNLAVIIDLDDPRIFRKLYLFAKEHKFRKFVYRINDQWQPNEVRIWVRRQRIADVKNQSKELIEKCDGEYVVCFEDDTVFDKLEFERLVTPLMEDQTIGFVEGVQCGRWGVKMIGAWQTDNVLNPTHIETLSLGEGYQDIDGGGFYGYATRKDLYLAHDYHTQKDQPWGPDVNYGLWLRSRGFRCLIDWESPFGHNDHNRILLPDRDISTITFKKNAEYNTWERHDVDKR